jgi:hypothetical protein
MNKKHISDESAIEKVLVVMKKCAIFGLIFSINIFFGMDVVINLRASHFLTPSFFTVSHDVVGRPLVRPVSLAVVPIVCAGLPMRLGISLCRRAEVAARIMSHVPINVAMREYVGLVLFNAGFFGISDEKRQRAMAEMLPRIITELLARVRVRRILMQ